MISILVSLVFSSPHSATAQGIDTIVGNWNGVAVEYAAGSIMFKLKNPALVDSLEKVLSNAGFVGKSWVRTRGDTTGIVDARGVGSAYHDSTRDITNLASALFSTDLFEWVEPNFITRSEGYAFEPDDDHFGDQWYFDQTSDADIDAPEAWDFTIGQQSVKIGIIDTGIPVDEYGELSHEDHHFRRFELLWKDGYQYWSDDHGEKGHGSLIAGILGAETDNGDGIAGIMSNGRILVCKSPVVMDYMYNALSELIDEDVDIVSFSNAVATWKDTTGVGQSHSAREFAEYVEEEEVYFVVTSKNNAPWPYLPSPWSCYSDEYDFVIGVGSSNKTDYQSNFSPSWGEDAIDLVAPGGTEGGTASENIISTGRLGGNHYPTSWGSSYATPLVAGTLGLMMSINPDLPKTKYRELLITGVDTVHSGTYDYDIEDEFGYRSEEMGYGRLNVFNAIMGMYTEIRGEWTEREEEPKTVAAVNTDAPQQNFYAHVVWDTLRTNPGAIDRYRLEKAEGSSEPDENDWYFLAYVQINQYSPICTYDDYMVDDGETYWYRVRPVDSSYNGLFSWSTPPLEIVIPDEPIGGGGPENINDPTIIPSSLHLDNAYPNPFNPTTQIKFSIPNATHVTLRILNTRGQLVNTLLDETMQRGWHTVTWNAKNNDGQDVASGIYLYLIEADGKRIIKRMTLMR